MGRALRFGGDRSVRTEGRAPGRRRGGRVRSQSAARRAARVDRPEPVSDHERAARDLVPARMLRALCLRDVRHSPVVRTVAAPVRHRDLLPSLRADHRRADPRQSPLSPATAASSSATATADDAPGDRLRRRFPHVGSRWDPVRLGSGRADHVQRVRGRTRAQPAASTTSSLVALRPLERPLPR